MEMPIPDGVATMLQDSGCRDLAALAKVTCVCQCSATRMGEASRSVAQ